MKTYEVFTEKYSKIYQADGIESVIRKHHKVSNDEIVAVTIADRPDLLSKIEQLEPEGEVYVEIDPKKLQSGDSVYRGTLGVKVGDHYAFEENPKESIWLKKSPPPQQPSDSAGEEVDAAGRRESERIAWVEGYYSHE